MGERNSRTFIRRTITPKIIINIFCSYIECLYIEVRINDNKTLTNMERISRFKEEIENLTGTLADLGDDSIILRYDNTQQEKKGFDLALLLHEGWSVNPNKRNIEVVLKKHKLGMGDVRYTKN